MSSSTRALLSKTRFAAGMSPDVVKRLAALADVADVPAGSQVIREGEPIAALGVVVSGRIALRLNVPGVGPQTILTVDDGDVFGWSAVMPGSRSTSTGTALVPTQALLFERERLLAAMAEDCELASAVYQRMLKVVARRLAATRVQLLDLYQVGHAS
ncbi:MAG TPA: cyclic nucleotide-binding domain-containing protein [Candidatus Limnocylindrales bacterium]